MEGKENKQNTLNLTVVSITEGEARLSPGLTAIFATGLAKRALRPPNLESRPGLGAAFYGGARRRSPMAAFNLKNRLSAIQRDSCFNAYDIAPLSFSLVFSSVSATGRKKFVKPFDIDGIIRREHYGICEATSNVPGIPAPSTVIFPLRNNLREGNFARGRSNEPRNNGIFSSCPLENYFKIAWYRLIDRFCNKWRCAWYKMKHLYN